MTPTQQAIEQATDYLNGNDLARPGFDEIRLLLAHIDQLTREKEELADLLKWINENPKAVHFSDIRGWRQLFGPKDDTNSFATIEDAVRYARAALAKHQQTP